MTRKNTEEEARKRRSSGRISHGMTRKRQKQRHGSGGSKDTEDAEGLLFQSRKRERWKAMEKSKKINVSSLNNINLS